MTVHLRAFVAAVSFVAIEAFASADLALEPLVRISQAVTKESIVSFLREGE